MTRKSDLGIFLAGLAILTGSVICLLIGTVAFFNFFTTRGDMVNIMLFALAYLGVKMFFVCGLPLLVLAALVFLGYMISKKSKGETR